MKYLGVLLDETMSFNHHISYICARIARNNGIISKLRHYLTFLQMKQIYYSLRGSVPKNGPIDCASKNHFSLNSADGKGLVPKY